MTWGTGPKGSSTSSEEGRAEVDWGGSSGIAKKEEGSDSGALGQGVGGERLAAGLKHVEADDKILS